MGGGVVMSIYKLDYCKLESGRRPYGKHNAITLYFDLWPASDYYTSGYATGYAETEEQYKQRTIKPLTFYRQGVE